MTAAIFDLTGDYAIEQNAQYRLSFTYPGDVRGAAVRGQIRKSYGGELVGDFRQAEASYSPETDKTTFIVGFDSRQTSRMAIPDTGQHWVYDLYLRPGGEDNIRILRGAADVLANVTEI